MADLRAGDWVEVRSAQEILATLDERGRLEALPFMPEMLQFCGRRFRVFKRADRTCDTITYRGMRRMRHGVHLEGVRCDGASHAGCQAQCLTFWKEAWLKRVDARSAAREATAPLASNAPIDEAGLARNARVDEQVFSCQATELNRATTELSRWDIRQYVRDVRSRNVQFREVVRWIAFEVITALLRIRGYRVWMWTYNRFARWLGGVAYPAYTGTLTTTPIERLDLKPGEMVRITDREAIVSTLNTRNHNRGLSFDVEMVNFCGGTFRVLSRVERIIDEKTGRMIHFGNPNVVLEGVTCQAYYKNKGCPRSIYPFWREIWLKRVEDAEGRGPLQHAKVSLREGDHRTAVRTDRT